MNWFENTGTGPNFTVIIDLLYKWYVILTNIQEQ